MSPNHADLLAETARRTLGVFDLGPAPRIGVAVSGGSDSSAALLLVAALGRERNFPVVALHIDHGLRGPAASEREEALVRRLAASVGATVAVEAIDVAAARASGGGSLEFVARRLRHAAWARMAEAQSLTHLVLGHHRDDQDETVLLSLLRGAWPAALAGMPARRPLTPTCDLLRPFLSLRKQELLAFTAGHETAHDPTNEDLLHRRNAVRSVLLPALDAAEPGVSAVLEAIRQEAGAASAAAEARADAILAAMNTAFAQDPGLVEFPLAVLGEAAAFTRAALLRRICRDDPGFGGAADWNLLREFEHTLAQAGDRRVELRREVWLDRRGDRLFLCGPPPPNRGQAWHVTAGRSALIFDDGVRQVRASAAPLAETVSPSADPRRICRLRLAPGARLEARAARSSDRFALERGLGHQSVRDLLVDRRVPYAWRRRVPLVVAAGQVEWIVGLRHAAAAPAGTILVTLNAEGPLPWLDSREAGPPHVR